VRILFWGSPAFSIPSLEGLIERGYRIVAVVTREDKPSGRGGRMSATPVKCMAVERGLEVLQPPSTYDQIFLKRLAELSPDLSVVVAYGKLLKSEALYLPAKGSICVHPSLLPKYRGASPVQRAILAGEEETGVSIFRMDEGMDSGDILARRSIRVMEGENAGGLSERLGRLSSDLLLDFLPQMQAGAVAAEPQVEEEATSAPKIEKWEAEIDWKKEPAVLELESRAFDPRPGPYAFLGGERIRMFGLKEVRGADLHGGRHGEVVGIEGGCPVIRAGGGLVKVTEFQSPGRKRMDASSWMRGRRLKKGTIFGRRS
jgi:methionyl-tRNA formyltransferase